MSRPKISILALVVFLAVITPGTQLQTQAGADVIHGKQPAFFLVPLPSIPGDAEVLVFSEGTVDVQMVFRPNGSILFNERKVIEITSSQVFARDYDYQVRQFEVRNRVHQGKRGQSTAYLQLELTLLRIDRSTAQPVAQLHGEGRTHLTVNAHGELTAQVGSMDWIESPEP